MKFVFLSTLLFVFGQQVFSANADQRTSSQASNYEFPAVRKAQYEELIEQYDPRVAAAQNYNPTVADPQDYSGGSYSQPSSYRGSTASSRTRSQYRSDKEDEEARRLAEEEEEKKPDRLALLLQESKFACDDKKDGYYADETVGCQVFHYCVAGAKHSWQCPENTVFHQIHLNCVPAAQDICSQSSKFHVVNDYLYKELEQRGPNNSVRYAQRFYPEGFDFGGDVLSQVLPPSPPQRAPQRPQYNSYDSDDSDSYQPRGNSRSQADSYPSYQSYPAPAPAPVRSQPAPQPRPQPVSRPVYRPPARTTQTYSVPSYTTPSQPKPTARPISYSTQPQYSSSYADSDDSDSGYDSYPSSSSYTPSQPASTSYSSYSPALSSAINSALTSSARSYSSPVSPQSSHSSSYSPSSYSSGSVYSSGGSSGSDSSATLSSYKPAAKPASYPSRGIGIPIASFRVANNQPSYGSSASASRVSSAAYPRTSSFSLGAFNSEMASGVKYDEDY